jgi:hypothetical protein
VYTQSRTKCGCAVCRTAHQSDICVLFHLNIAFSALHRCAAPRERERCRRRPSEVWDLSIAVSTCQWLKPAGLSGWHSRGAGLQPFTALPISACSNYGCCPSRGGLATSGLFGRAPIAFAHSFPVIKPAELRQQLPQTALLHINSGDRHDRFCSGACIHVAKSQFMALFGRHRAWCPCRRLEQSG